MVFVCVFLLLHCPPPPPLPPFKCNAHLVVNIFRLHHIRDKSIRCLSFCVGQQFWASVFWLVPICPQSFYHNRTNSLVHFLPPPSPLYEHTLFTRHIHSSWFYQFQCEWKCNLHLNPKSIVSYRAISITVQPNLVHVVFNVQCTCACVWTCLSLLDISSVSVGLTH